MLKRTYDEVSDIVPDTIEMLLKLFSKYDSKHEKLDLIIDDIYNSEFNIFDNKEECTKYVQYMNTVLSHKKL